MLRTFPVKDLYTYFGLFVCLYLINVKAAVAFFWKTIDEFVALFLTHFRYSQKVYKQHFQPKIFNIKS